MSEYQYYEFQAIDRPLTQREMAELSSFSTQARMILTCSRERTVRNRSLSPGIKTSVNWCTAEGSRNSLTIAAGAGGYWPAASSHPTAPS